MARRIDKLQINALNASNNQILVARAGELAFDDASNIFAASGGGDAGFANIALEANFANTAGVANVSLLADTANVALEANFANTAGIANVTLEANIANLVLTLSNFTTDDLNEGSGNLYYTDARVDTYLSSSDISIGGNLSVVGTLDTPNFSVSNTLTVGSQIIYAQGTNGFSVNEDFDPSANALQTAYHFTSGAGRETVAFTLARTAQFTNGFGIRGTSADNKMVNFGEQNNTSFEWRKGVGIQPLNLGGGTLLANLSSVGDFYVIGNVTALGFYGESVSAGAVSANSFASTGFGVPTIESATSINLSANGASGGAVVIQDSALRLRSFTEGEVANLTASAGDAVFNSSINKAQIYDGTNWANVGAGLLSGDQNYTGNLLPDVSNTYNLGSSDYRWKDLYLSGNTIHLGDTLLSSSNSKLVVNSIEANVITISNPTIYSSGRGISISTTGVIATSADDSESYDIGIDYHSPYMVTDSMEIAATTPSTAGYRYLLYSFVVTNISSDNAYLDSEIYYNNNTYVFANAYMIPYGESIDLVSKPAVFYGNTSIRLKANANDTVSSYITYKSIDDLSFEKQFTSIDQSDTYIELYSPISGPAIVENIRLVNHTNVDLRGTLLVTDSSDTVKGYIGANTLLTNHYFTDVTVRPLRLSPGDKIKFSVFGAETNGITAFVGARLGESYTITPNVTTASEGDIVRFQIDTINVPNFSTRYFRTSGNVISADFVEGNTGSFLVVDNVANVTLTIAEDGSNISFEGEETFRFEVVTVADVLLKASEDIVLIKDTSNAATILSTYAYANSIYEGEAVIITLNAINAEGANAATFYYTITGNADIYSGTSGSILISDNTANLEIIAEASVPSTEVRSFAVQIRSGSVSGPILDTSDTIRVYSADTPGISATGGNQILEIDI